MGRPTQAILSKDNLLHNFYQIKSLAPHSKIISMLKSNGYGHHMGSVAQILDSHTDCLGVASIDEALNLRRNGIKSDIVLMEGIFEPDELAIAESNRFHVVFHHDIQILWLRKASLQRPITAWLKIDTGMGRLGFNIEDVPEAHQALSTSGKVVIPIGILSHFACADFADNPQNWEQIRAFQTVTQEFSGPKSLSNSAGIFNFPDQCFDYIRPGISLYGVSPVAGKTASNLNLKPVMTFMTKIIAVNMRRKGSNLGYGSRFSCPENIPVGVIAAGYGDGYPRTARDGTPVLVNGSLSCVIGRVSMDLTLIDLRNCPTAKVGDTAVLWGEGLPIEFVTPFTRNIPYDLLTGIQARVKLQWQ